jgi:hypothetical protein
LTVEPLPVLGHFGRSTAPGAQFEQLYLEFALDLMALLAERFHHERRNHFPHQFAFGLDRFADPAVPIRLSASQRRVRITLANRCLVETHSGVSESTSNTGTKRS